MTAGPDALGPALDSALWHEVDRFLVRMQAARGASDHTLRAYGTDLADLVGFLAGRGVTANSLALGLMAHVGDADSVAAMARTVPVGRLGTPEDVGAAVTYMASNEAGWLTGQTLGLNGGSTTS